jgi:hypothetical protein
MEQIWKKNWNVEKIIIIIKQIFMSDRDRRQYV